MMGSTGTTERERERERERESAGETEGERKREIATGNQIRSLHRPPRSEICLPWFRPGSKSAYRQRAGEPEPEEALSVFKGPNGIAMAVFMGDPPACLLRIAS